MYHTILRRNRHDCVVLIRREIMALATKLTILRANKGASLKQVADELGVSKTHIWQLEKGITDNPTLELITKLANFYNKSIQFLIGENPESSNSDELALAMFRKIGDLDEIDKEAINEMIESMLKRKQKLENDARQNRN